jgi:6-phosphogluconolactonase
MKKFSSLLILTILSTLTFAQKANYNLIVGTYTAPGKSEGIYTYNFNTATAETRIKSITKNTANPSYLAISPDQKFVYAVNETGTTSTVSAFKYNATTGDLTFLNKVDSHGADPCFITVDAKKCNCSQL